MTEQRKTVGNGGFSVEGIIDKKVLDKMQERFCSVANLYSFIMDDRGRMLTEMTGSDGDVRAIYDALGQESFFHIYDRVSGDSLEDQVVEDTAYANVRLAAFRVNVRPEPALHWIVCAVFDENRYEQNAPDGESGTSARAVPDGESGTSARTVPDEESGTSARTVPDEERESKDKRKILRGLGRHIREDSLYDALDLMRLTAGRMLGDKNTLANMEAERLKAVSDNQNMSVLLKHAQATTGVVQTLASNEPIETVFGHILQITGEYLDLSGAQVFQLNTDGKTMNLLSGWCGQGVSSVFGKTKNIADPELFLHERTNVISSDTVCSARERALMEEAHIRAMVTFPMMINGRLSMCAAFDECRRERQWKVDEIRFMNDAVQVMQNILLRRIQKNSVMSSYASLEAILDHVGCAICVRDAESERLLFVNRVWKSTFTKETAAGIRSALVGARRQGQPENVEFCDVKNDRHYDLYTTDITWVDGRGAVLLAAYDITEKKVYQKKIEQLAYTDYLTGLYNRMCCERDLAVEIEHARRYGEKGALLYLDLDDFKHINDGLGHQYGDVLLKQIAQGFAQIEGLSESCYRMGGDEFVIIVPIGVYPRLEMILDRIRERFAKPWFLKDSEYYCTMSMGVIVFPDEGDSVEDLICKADIAMYEAKRGGKNRIVRYTNEISSESGKRLDMEKNMRYATALGCMEFEVYYQPIVDISRPGQPCTGAEALLRWNSAELGFIPPSDFIPLAEYLGLINPIGNYVLTEACRTLRAWNDNGYPGYKVNVNLSVVQLLQNDIVESIEKVVIETGINPHNLTLEVTERLAINDMERMKDILGRIKKLGIRIALDDFGTGYSSLNYIKEMPLDVIKVDQTFVRDLDKDSYAQAFVKMVSELAQSLGVSVCVEGIERKEQLEVLDGMKVCMIQGYYFGKPAPKEQFNREFAPKLGKERIGQ